MENKRFIGKNVIITGGGTGIGQATAFRFASEGADVLITGRRLEPLKKTIRRWIRSNKIHTL